jgi:hypothetical protein
LVENVVHVLSAQNRRQPVDERHLFWVSHEVASPSCILSRGLESPGTPSFDVTVIVFLPMKSSA